MSKPSKRPKRLTIREVIELLQGMDQDASLYIADGLCCGCPAHAVTEVFRARDYGRVVLEAEWEVVGPPGDCTPNNCDDWPIACEKRDKWWRQQEEEQRLREERIQAEQERMRSRRVIFKPLKPTVSPTTIGSLAKSDIPSLEALAAMTDEELLAVPNIGPGSVLKIRQALEKLQCSPPA